MGDPRRFIALEEHCVNPELIAAHAEMPWPSIRLAPPEFEKRLTDLDAARLSAMDELGIDVQVLSHRPPGAQLPDPERAAVEARLANDAIAAAIDRHPTRFAGFATVPLADPGAAAKELVRCVEGLGFVGVMVHGRVGGEFLDHPELDPVVGTAADLDVPIFLHPGEPNETIRNEYYDHLPVPRDVAPVLQSVFSGGAWGWHVEAGTHALRLILGGVFDRYPDLQVILGHWGELVPFYLARFDAVAGPVARHLRRRPAEYFAENFHITPSGLETIAPLLLSLSVVGADRIMYAADYPFVPTAGRAFIDEAPISDADKAKIAHLNAERLLGI